jgi:hypothetical protein
MGKRSPEDPAPAPDEADEAGNRGADLGLVLSISLLAGGLASYPSLSAVAEGKGELMGAVTTFLAAMLVAMVGFGTVTMLFRSFSAAHHAGNAEKKQKAVDEKTAAATTDEGDPLPLVTTERLDNQAHDIDEALAATDHLLHEDSGSS